MRYGLDFPSFGELADPNAVVEIARDAEAAGWDGVFLWDHIMYREPVTAATDPWIPLAAMAQATDRVRLGPMVTPLARRRPWIVARQAAAVDQLSAGRLVVGVGLGLDRSGRELSAFGEELDDRRRAGMLDESLDLIDRLWSGERVTHRGDHYRADDVRFLPRPTTRPRPPIWVAGRWPHRRPLQRAARWDGMFLIDIQPDQLAEACEFVRTARGDLSGFDVIVHDRYGKDPAAWRAAGATWWLTDTPYDAGADVVRAAARNGPPR